MVPSQSGHARFSTTDWVARRASRSSLAAIELHGTSRRARSQCCAPLERLSSIAPDLAVLVRLN
jgi:hypothetical protein